MDALVDELTAALGLGGRARRAGGAAERARSNGHPAHRGDQLPDGAVHPRLGRQLQAGVRTGTYCAYAPRPEDQVRSDI